MTNSPATSSEGTLPLPGWLTRVYYIFPIILYVPDMLFNFYVYSDGVTNSANGFDIANSFYYVLYAFLAMGIVGMAWLLSVLAPWHWGRGNHFQSIMCWAGVFIATAITTWNSLAYRSTRFSSFATDKWITDFFHISNTTFSPTMVLVAVAPPFWGLFWALVQPSEQRKSLADEREGHVMKLERMRQEAEVKRLKAETNAQIRESQLKGLAATVRAARSQIGATNTPQEVIVEADPIPQITDREEGIGSDLPPVIHFGMNAPSIQRGLPAHVTAAIGDSFENQN